MIWPFRKQTPVIRYPKPRTLIREFKPNLSWRSFESGLISRVSNQFNASQSSIEEDLRRSMRLMRDRCRKLYRDNGHIRRFVKSSQINIVGPAGFTLQVKNGDDSTDPLCDLIEKRWTQWCEQPEKSGRLTFRQICEQAVSGLKIDGEFLIRMRQRGRDFMLEIIDPDRLYEQKDQTNLSNGNRLSLGVEIDSFYRPIHYWILDGHPTDSHKRKVEEVPAETIIHVFRAERPGQTRGIPEVQTAIKDLDMLAGYKEAELVAARTAASKMGFYSSEQGEAYTGGEEQEDGSVVTELSPGTIETLPPGFKFQSFDPQHPVSAFGDFVKAVLRSISSALNISYTSLANDIEGTSYSSIRQDALQDRDGFREQQAFLIESLIRPVFREWLTHQVKTKQIDLDVSQLDRFMNPIIRGRGWSWVDPKKEIDAHVTALQNKITSRSRILSQNGEDFRELAAEIQREQQVADEFGIQLSTTEKNEEENAQEE